MNKPHGARHAMIAPYGPFPTGDGRTVMLGLQNEREWKVFCAEVLGDPALATDPRFATNPLRHENRDALRALIEQAFAALDSEQVLERLDKVGIARARMNTMADLWAHPQLAAREAWAQVGSPAGPIPALRPPGRSNAFDARMDPIPRLGEHTDAILGELGLSPSDIDRMRQAAAI